MHNLSLHHISTLFGNRNELPQYCHHEFFQYMYIYAVYVRTCILIVTPIPHTARYFRPQIHVFDIYLIQGM